MDRILEHPTSQTTTLVGKGACSVNFCGGVLSVSIEERGVLSTLLKGAKSTISLARKELAIIANL